MALFFDSAWFDAQLAKAGLKRADTAVVLGLSETEIAELWKDQRELRAQDVRVLAALLGVTREEIAARAGVSTPVPRTEGPGLEPRIARIEAELIAIRGELRALKEKLA
jgi:transcriptional regulator with XRE-family HTH domain